MYWQNLDIILEMDKNGPMKVNRKFKTQTKQGSIKNIRGRTDCLAYGSGKITLLCREN